MRTDRTDRVRRALRRSLLLVVAGSLLACVTSESEPREEAPRAEALVEPSGPTEVLRRLSFDLRGAPPTDEEYAQVLEAGEVPEALVTAMLESEAFLAQVEDWHAEILWPNISRYRITATQLTAVRPDRHDNWEDIGWAPNGGGHDVAADPVLVDDEAERARFVLAFESEGTGITLRGGRHAWPGHFCDMRAEAEYPDPSVVGTPANRYTVPAEKSGTGVAYTWTYYSEDPAHLGLVQPIHDWEHCSNYCFQTSCGEHETAGDHLDTDGDGNHDCYSDMNAAGDDPEGRHILDVPGMRCPDGYERIVNTCDFAQEFAENGRGRKPARGGERASRYNSMRDGWRWQTHYWSRGVPIRTCAVEAQQREHGLIRNAPDGSPIRCAEVRADRGFNIEDPSCGCGPEGVYCQPSQSEYLTEDETRTEFRLRRAIQREPLRIVRSVIERDEDYLSILTTRRSYVDGPLALAWDQQTSALGGEGDIRVSPPGDRNPLWSTIEYESDEWVEYERGEQHSGVLTTLEFLLRFPTARSRISQYRRAFVCSEEFDYAPQPDPADNNPDIAARSGCSSCHARLEGDGMWYARYPDRTGLFLTPSAYPIENEACRYCMVGADGTGRSQRYHQCGDGASNPFVPSGVVVGDQLEAECRAFYAGWPTFGDREAEYAGRLWPAVYRPEALHPRIDEGPRGMVAADLEAGDELQRCTVERTWDRLVRRPASQEEITELTSAFEEHGRSYRALIRAIVESEAYRSSGAPEEM